jgi:hypothetical protein
MPLRRSSPRLGPPIGSTYLLRSQCRHGRYKTEEVALGYAVPGCVCEGCLADRPALALLNTNQARQVREFLKDPDLRASNFAEHGDVVGPALNAVNWANDLCKMVHRTRRMDLQGKKASVVIVCSCMEELIVNVTLDVEIPGQRCARCRLVLPSVRWIPGHLGGEYTNEMPTIFETRRALQDAQGLAPIVPFPTG